MKKYKNKNKKINRRKFEENEENYIIYLFIFLPNLILLLGFNKLIRESIKLNSQSYIKNYWEV